MGRQRGRESYELRKRSGRRRRNIWVFTEGELTEPQYVDLVKDLQLNRRNDVHIANDSRRDGGRRGSGGHGSGRKPRDIIKAAIARKAQLDKEADSAKIPQEFRPAVWCIFDRDQHADIDAVMALAQQAGVKVAFSHPCFELWRLLHRQPFTATCGGACDEVAQRLPFGKGVSMTQIQGGFVQARQRAIQMNAKHGDHVPFSRRDPYTDVWKFVEDLGVISY